MPGEGVAPQVVTSQKQLASSRKQGSATPRRPLTFPSLRDGPLPLPAGAREFALQAIALQVEPPRREAKSFIAERAEVSRRALNL